MAGCFMGGHADLGQVAGAQCKAKVGVKDGGLLPVRSLCAAQPSLTLCPACHPTPAGAVSACSGGA